MLEPMQPPSDFARARLDGGRSLPLVLEADRETRLEPLVEWLCDERDWVANRIQTHGAVLLRGFEVQSPPDFEAVCRAIAPQVTADFVGTPRTRLTEVVTPASQGPPEYPIPMHSELSILPIPPTRIFFGCLVPPAPGSGETPLVDNRVVWEQMPSDVKRRFKDVGTVRIVRNMTGPKSRFGPFTLERWDEFFATTDKDAVEQLSAGEDWQCRWRGDDKLQLVFHQPVTRDHPVTGETAWCNQLISYSVTSSAYDFRRLFKFRPSRKLWLRWQFVRTMAQIKKRFPISTVPATCTRPDGSRFPEEDVDAVRELVWKHLVHPTWEAGSVLAVDNFNTAHGRFPSWGERRIMACVA